MNVKEEEEEEEKRRGEGGGGGGRGGGGGGWREESMRETDEFRGRLIGTRIEYLSKCRFSHTQLCDHFDVSKSTPKTAC